MGKVLLGATAVASSSASPFTSSATGSATSEVATLRALVDEQAAQGQAHQEQVHRLGQQLQQLTDRAVVQSEMDVLRQRVGALQEMVRSLAFPFDRVVFACAVIQLEKDGLRQRVGALQEIVRKHAFSHCIWVVHACVSLHECMLCLRWQGCAVSRV